MADSAVFEQGFVVHNEIICFTSFSHIKNITFCILKKPGSETEPFLFDIEAAQGTQKSRAKTKTVRN